MNKEDNQKHAYVNRQAGAQSKRKLIPRKPQYLAALIVMGLIAIAFLLMLIMLNTLPADLVMILLVIMFGLLFFTSFLFASKRRGVRVCGIACALIFALIFVSATGFMGSTYAMLRNISKSDVKTTEARSAKKDITKEAFNIYITGIDQWEEEKGEDAERSDVNMIVTVNPVTKKILLTSIPRDSYVKLHSTQEMDKLTHTGIYGVDETLNTVEDWLGVDLSYYYKMNFSAAVDIIDAIGGIKVYSPVAFESSLKGYKYQKGWNYLGGYKALYFARERHAFEDEDEARVENQQRVVKAIIKKMTTSPAVLTNYGKIMNAASRNLETNMTSEEILSLVKMQLTDLAEWDVQTQKLDGESSLEHVASLSSKNKYYVMKPKEESVRKCIEAIRTIENPTDAEVSAAEKRSKRGFIANVTERVINKIKKTDEEK